MSYLLQAVDFNIFEGMKCRGAPVVVISQGRVCVENGKVYIHISLVTLMIFTQLKSQVEVVKGCGRFIPRQPYADVVYSRIHQRDKVCLPFLVIYMYSHFEVIPILVCNYHSFIPSDMPAPEG